jgi:hypothetical protein
MEKLEKKKQIWHAAVNSRRHLIERGERREKIHGN